MALQKQNIDLLFTQGLNTKTDNKSTLRTSLISLENAVFTKYGALNKRYGYTALGTIDCTAQGISNMKAVMAFQEDELLLSAGNSFYSYSPNTTTWVEKDRFVSASVVTEKIVSNSAEQTKLDMVSKDGVTLYAWEDSRGGIRYSVQDEATGSYFINDAELDASGDTPRCVAVGANLIVFYGNGTNLSFKYTTIGDPCTISGSGNTRTNLHTDHLFDVINIGNKAYCFYKTTTATEAALIEINPSGGLTNVITLTSYTIVDTLALSTYKSATVDYLNLVYKQDANTVRCAVYTNSFVSVVAAKDLDATASTDIEKIALARTDADTDQVTVFYQVPAAANSNDYIRKNTLSLDGTVGTPSIFIRSLGLASRAFNDDDGNLYVNCLHESDLQATVFTLDAIGDVVCKFSVGNAGTHDAIGAFPSNVVGLGDNTWCFAMNTKGRIRSENATIFSRLGINKSCIDFQSLNTYTNAQLNRNLNVVGGVLHSYDSKSITEQGFHLYPEGSVTSSTPTTGGNLSDGTYGYAFVYTWIDAKGNRHQSAPEYTSVTLSGGTSTQRVVWDIPTLRITKKTAPRTEITIEVYRTEDAGSIYYRISEVASPLDNDTSADTVQFDDDTAADPVGGELLYTTGGVLDNISAPSCDLVITHQDRLFIAGLENENEVRYSKLNRLGEGTAFNEALSISVDPRGGAITQLASMDANLIIFKKNNIYTVVGNGPSDTGVGATFNDPQLISSDVGCIDANSVILGPEGLYFKSAKGIYLLNRSLGVSYVGAQVEDFNSETIVSSQLLDDVNEIRFATGSGVTLVYNYYFQQWSTFTGQSSVDSVIWQDQYVYLGTDDKVYVENKATFLDNGSNVKMKIATGWVSLTGLQGFQRASRVSVLGEYKSRHTLRLTQYVDYSTTLKQTSEFTTSSILGVDSDFYGDGSYGEMAEYGGSDNGVYQFETHLKYQKCQAVRFVIEDIIDNGVDIGTGESLSVSGITIQIGTKRGTNKLPGGKTN